MQVHDRSVGQPYTDDFRRGLSLAGEVRNPVPDHWRQAATHGLGQDVAAWERGVPAILPDLIVAHDDVARQRVIAQVGVVLVVGHQQHGGGLVAVDLVFEDVHVAVGHHHHAGSGRHVGDDVAFRREVGRVVVDHLV